MPQLPLNLSHTFNTWFGLQWNWGQESRVFTWKARDLPVHLEAGYFKHKLIWCHYFASCAVRYEILTPTLSPTLLIIIITCYSAIETLPGHRQRLEAERTELTLLTVRQWVTVCREFTVTADGSWLEAARGPTPPPPTHQVRKEGWTSVTCRNNCDNMLGYWSQQ